MRPPFNFAEFEPIFSGKLMYRHYNVHYRKLFDNYSTSSFMIEGLNEKLNALSENQEDYAE
jgi:hypothetical protein